MRALILAAVAAMMVTTPAMAGPVALRSNPVDADGRVTLGDIFDGAGNAANVVVGQRNGPSIVFEAGQLQGLARQAGLDWANPTGLRRVVVRAASAAPGALPTLPEGVEVAAGGPAPARLAPVRASVADRVISRNDIVEVAYENSGIRLTITGRAEGNATAGQRIAIRNLQSNRVIDAVATAPGMAVAGPAAQALRAEQFAAR